MTAKTFVRAVTSRRQKDLADIARLVEVYPELLPGLPAEVRELVV